MKRTLIKELSEHIDKEVTIGAWVDVARDQGKMAFFDFRDRSGRVQGVVFGKPDVLEVAKTLRPEWVVNVTGKVNKRPEKMIKEGVLNGDIELEITGFEILAKAAEMPFELDGDLNLDTLLDNRPLTLRRTRERAIFRVQSAIVDSYREGLQQQDFTEFQAPKLVGDDAEGGGNVFKLEYFKGQDAYLATSPQLYKQILVGSLERVFTTGNVFRAELHATTRHLNEYTSLDAEMGFIESHEDVMQVLETTLKHIVSTLQKEHGEDFATVGAELPKAPDQFPRIKFRDAQKLITEATGEDCTKEPDLEPAHERWLCEYALKEFGSDFIFVTHYPTKKRPFYTFVDPEDPEHTYSFDLLFRGVEITTGGRRVHEYDEYLKRLESKGLDPKNFAFYLQAFKYGMPPHGGWGMGLERLTQKFLGLSNVKEATLFPRDINRIDTLLSKSNEE